MKKIILTLIALTIALSIPLQTFAQDTNGACHYQDEAGNLQGGNLLNFEDCATTVYFEMNRDFRTEANGSWGDYQVMVNYNREVYYSLDGSNWEFAGTLDLDMTLEEIFALAEADLNAFWGAEFSAAGMVYEPPRIVLYTQRSVPTACGTGVPAIGPFYCPRDHTMYYPYSFMQAQYDEIGDFAVVIIIAHEWAHAVQRELGITLSQNYTIELELQADCLAGAYSEYAANRSELVVLEYGDIDEAAAALFYAGDPHGTPWFDERAHGSGTQRNAAFYKGYEFGHLNCWAFAE